MAALPGTALVRVKAEPEIMVTDLMGSMIATLNVGTSKKPFMVHSKLLSDASGVMERLLCDKPGLDGSYDLDGVNCDVFVFFVEILYSQRVPGVVPGSDAETISKRILQLCRFYVFGEKFEVKPEIVNKTMDAIQDGFRILNRFPEYGLIQNIYRNTASGNKLRDFCARCIAYDFLTGGADYDDNGGLETLLVSEQGFLHDFLKDIRNPVGGFRKDPRIRNSVSEPVKQDVLKDGVFDAGGEGWWPCLYHIHSPAWVPYVENEAKTNYDENPFHVDCHLVN